MGYSHYWSVDMSGVKRPVAERDWKTCLRACQSLIYAVSQAEGGLSGFNAHTKPGVYGGLKLNGSRENAAEDFCFREHWSENVGRQSCKTYQRQYDACVVACLCIIDHYMGRHGFTCSSDGDAQDWLEGIALVHLYTRLQVRLPGTIRSPTDAVQSGRKTGPVLRLVN